MPTIAVRDLTMHYLERGDGDRTAIVMHPATVGGAEMTWLAPTLEDRGFTSYYPDQRAHGRTEGPAPDLKLNTLAADLREFAYQLGHGPYHGVGFSLGAGALMEAARQQPETFKSLVLMGNTFQPLDPVRVDAVAGPPETRTGLKKLVFDPEIGYAAPWDSKREDLAVIPVPVLLICGDRDEFFSVENMVELYHILPDAELLIVPNAGHFDLVRHPLVISAIADFYRHILS